MSALKQFRNSTLEINRTYHGMSMHRYRVALVAGEWPAEGELISLCDGNDGILRCDFGGSVAISGQTADVTVHVD